MSIDRLDLVLETARDLEPADDGFTEIVMQGIRAGHKSRSPKRRFVTRPAILATAAVLATGGALAAAVRTTTQNPARSASAPAVSARPTERAGSAGSSTTPAGSGAPAVRPHGSAAAQPTEAAPPAVRHFKNAVFEWGYTSAHTSYVLDKRSGLRFVTETKTTTAVARRVREVSLTVTNTTKDTVAVSSQSGCAVSAAAWAGRVPDASSAAVTTRDPSTAKYWECAGAGSRSVGPDEFVLAPGASRTQVARLTLAPGRWAVAGICRCTVVSAAQTRDGMTLNGVRDLAVVMQAPADRRVATPPVVVVAR